MSQPSLQQLCRTATAFRRKKETKLSNTLDAKASTAVTNRNIWGKDEDDTVQIEYQWEVIWITWDETMQFHPEHKAL